MEGVTEGAAAAGGGSVLLHVRHEPFEYGQLQLPQLCPRLAEGPSSLLALKAELLAESSDDAQVSIAKVASTLSLSPLHTQILLETLAGLVEEQPAAETVSVYPLLLLLFVQFCNKLAHRRHVDASAIADIWPTTPVSPHGQGHGYSATAESPGTNSFSSAASMFSNSSFSSASSLLSPASPNSSSPANGLQWPVVRSRVTSMEQDAHEASFVKQHVGLLLPLVQSAQQSDSEVSAADFDRLGFLLFSESPRKRCRLSDFVPLFNSAVSVAVLKEWLVSHICARQGLQSTSATAETVVENIVSVDSASTSVQRPQRREGCCYVEGVMRTSAVKDDKDVEGDSLRVADCHDSVIYVLAPLRYASVSGCTDCTILIGAVGKALKVEHCERVQLIVACRRIRISNCRESSFFLGVKLRPLLLGDNRHLEVAPYNTFYPQLGQHLVDVGLDPSVNNWDRPVGLVRAPQENDMDEGETVDGVSKRELSLLSPEKFLPFVVPFRPKEPFENPTLANPYTLPVAYAAALESKIKAVADLRQAVRDANLEEGRRRDLQNVIQLHFKDWLQTSGNLRQVYDLARIEKGDV
eukprot:jgi/Chlat1/6464/Chrsp45S05975